MEKEIERFLKSDSFGKGNISPCAYNTAWVARIRSNEDRNRPQFQQCIEFLRNTQHEDGYWGSNHPCSLFERIISTLAVILCFKQWNLEEDRKRITDGQRYVKEKLLFLHKPEEAQDQMTIGFELILPRLIDESKRIGLEFGSETLIGQYRVERERKINAIKKCESRVILKPHEKPWYFTLEALEWNRFPTEEFEAIKKIMAENELICGSYAPTAFAMTKGIPSPCSLKHISEIVAENDGGVIEVVKCPNFEISWSIGTLILSGFKIEKYLDSSLDYLEEVWKSKKGWIGASNYLPPDADDISNALFVLSETRGVKDLASLESLLQFKRDDSFITFQAENHRSLSSNINALIALRNFRQYQDIDEMSMAVAEWTKKWIIGKEFKFEDKWHSSQYYSMCRALIAFVSYDLGFAKELFDKILKAQNEDGGWGMNGLSSRLETAYAVISIIYVIRSAEISFDQKTIFETKVCLRKANEFIEEERSEDGFNFWIGKSLYSIINLDKLTILCARFALEKLKADFKAWLI